jgi:hypothetical protein
MGNLIALAIVTLVCCIVSQSIAPIVLAAVPGYFIIRKIRMEKYFASEDFQHHKAELVAVVDEFNDMSEYVNDIRRSGTFNIGRSTSGSNAGLASFDNTSNYAYKRDRNVADYSSKNVHNGGLQLVRNAKADPIKYLMKYFDVSATEEKLTDVESLGESISRMENAIQNLNGRERSISQAISPPPFILKHYLKRFREEIGIKLPSVSVPYPVYKFQYVSAGGNSSQVTTVTLNSPTIDALINTLSEKIKFKKSAAGQRSLMTARFREQIKIRDNYACKLCEVSTRDEEHLLLEIDHITPVSKGGQSVESNLQTLCWKCNRTKSNK